jgi:hypothetical protein
VLQPFLAGTGQIEQIDSIMRLTLPNASRETYADAQLDDYAGRSRRSFPHRPPARFAIRARFSSDAIIGTAGFGLWNHPFAPGSGRPALPRALWFFYASPPSNMQLALDVPGRGWKAAVIDATKPSALLLLPFAPIALVLNQSLKMYRRLWPFVQRNLSIAEESLPTEWMPDWHDYAIDWEMNRARMRVDERVVLETERPPHGSMGFVMWIDNQYAIVTPQGRLKFGLLDALQPQWLEIKTSEVV